jgi:hypothetical protein
MSSKICNQPFQNHQKVFHIELVIKRKIKEDANKFESKNKGPYNNI